MFALTLFSVVGMTLGASVGMMSGAKDCSAPRDRGDNCPNGQQKQMFYFDSQQKMCQPFMYNGCAGNGNRFSSSRECQDYCINGEGAQKLRDQSSSGNTEAEAMAQACNAEYATTQLNITRCTTNQQCQNGSSCSNGYCCFQPAYLCNMNYDAGKFTTTSVKSDRYFFTKQYNTCMRFSYYGTLGNANNFPNYNACMRMCGSQRS